VFLTAPSGWHDERPTPALALLTLFGGFLATAGSGLANPSRSRGTGQVRWHKPATPNRAALLAPVKSEPLSALGRFLIVGAFEQPREGMHRLFQTLSFVACGLH
jgi:hypothetical protein